MFAYHLCLLSSAHPFANSTRTWLQVSLRLFDLTNVLKSAYLPSKDNVRLGANALCLALFVAGLYFLSNLLMLGMGAMVSIISPPPPPCRSLAIWIL